MNPIPRIISKVWREPWAIRPERLHAIASAIKDRNQALEVDIKDQRPNAGFVKAQSSVAVIPVFGVIGKHLSALETMCGGVDANAISNELDEAASSAAVSSILLYVNSPGGTVTGIPELAAKIAQIDKQKPVYAFTDADMASAAYWIASSARGIFATPSANVGSIGVYMLTLDESKALEDAGISVNAISAGEWKLAGASFKPLSQAERDMFQAGVDKIYGQFKDSVTAKRNVKDEYMQGQVFDGEEAFENGLVDDVVMDIGSALELIQG